MELTLDLSTVAIAEHAHDGHLDFDQLGRLVFDWEDRPTWACGPTAMLDAVEKVWDDAGLRDGLHMERFTIARTDTGGEGGTVTFSISDKRIEIDGATSLLEAGEKVGFRCRSAAGWASARRAFCRWNQGTSATSDPAMSTAKAIESTRASPRHPAIAPSKVRGRHGYYRHQAVCASDR